jgi:uncharacterized protein
MSRATRQTIENFLESDAFAVIGVSADRRKFGNVVFRTMKEKQAVVYPVHRTLETVEGDACYGSVAALPANVQAVVTVVPPSQTAAIVSECAARGIKQIWMQPGSESGEAIAEAERAGIQVVAGECILMFLEPVGSLHKVHRFVNKVVGKYPK